MGGTPVRGTGGARWVIAGACRSPSWAAPRHARLGERVEVEWRLDGTPDLEWTEVFQFAEVDERQGPVDWTQGGGPDVVGDTVRWFVPSSSLDDAEAEVARRPRGGQPAVRADTGRGRGLGDRMVTLHRPGRRRLAAGRGARGLPRRGRGGAGAPPRRGPRGLPGGLRPRRPARRDRRPQARGPLPAGGGDGRHRRRRRPGPRPRHGRPGRRVRGRGGRGRTARAGGARGQAAPLPSRP